jgi:hypothetical protein
MLWWMEGRLFARTSKLVLYAAPVLVAACGGTSRNEHNPPSGHAGKATAGGGHGAGGSGGSAAGTGGSSHGGTGGSSAGTGGSSAGKGGESATGGTGGSSGHATGGAGTGGSMEAGAAGESVGGTAGIEAGGRGGNANAGAGMGGSGGRLMGGFSGMAPLGPIEPAVSAYCGAVSTCCGMGTPVTLDTCESNYAMQSANFASLAAGLVALDATVLAKCQAAYAGPNPCDLNAVVAACQGLFIGTRAVNESCTQGYDCDRSQGEMTCLIAGDCNTNPMGVCTPVPHAKEGETCLATCETGEDCSSTTCGVGDTNALCFEDDGLYCEYFDSGSICRPITPVGTTCSSSASQECGSEAYCDVTCKALSKLGEDCGYGCRHELQCDPDTMKCVDPVWNDEYSCMGYAPGL